MDNSQLCVFSLVDGHVLSGFWADVGAAWPDQLVVGSLLNDVRRPTTGTGDHEDWSEEQGGDSTLVIGTSRKEV